MSAAKTRSKLASLALVLSLGAGLGAVSTAATVALPVVPGVSQAQVAHADGVARRGPGGQTHRCKFPPFKSSPAPWWLGGGCW